VYPEDDFGASVTPPDVEALGTYWWKAQMC